MSSRLSEKLLSTRLTAWVLLILPGVLALSLRPFFLFQGSGIAARIALLVPTLGIQDPAHRGLVAAVLILIYWLGLAFAVRRLSRLGWPTGLAGAALVPGLREILLLVLGILPEPVAPVSPERPSSRRATLTIRTATLSILVSIATGLVAMLLGVFTFKAYGFALYVITPFAMGYMTSTWSYWSSNRETLPVGQSLQLGFLSILAMGAVLWLTALEGLICIAMAFPIGLLLCWAGVFAGRTITRGARQSAKNQGTNLSALAPLPLLFLATSAIEPYLLVDGPLRVTSETVIEAPADQVWTALVGLRAFSEPNEWYFRAGIAYPVGARIEGLGGVGATRHCYFSTGDMVETIVGWKPGEQLKFEIHTQPDPMVELSVRPDVHPPHLHGYIRSLTGEFRLSALGPGRTKIEGISEYDLKIQPVTYWRWISDWLYHRIHERVFSQVRAHATGGAP